MPHCLTKSVKLLPLEFFYTGHAQAYAGILASILANFYVRHSLQHKKYVFLLLTPVMCSLWGALANAECKTGKGFWAAREVI